MRFNRFNLIIFSFLSMSINRKANTPSAMTLSPTNFLKLPYEYFSNHMDIGIYGPILKGSSFFMNEFRLS